jgi:hypothetical protein
MHVTIGSGEFLQGKKKSGKNILLKVSQSVSQSVSAVACLCSAAIDLDSSLLACLLCDD